MKANTVQDLLPPIHCILGGYPLGSKTKETPKWESWAGAIWLGGSKSLDSGSLH